MSRTLRSVELSSRTSRSRLPRQRTPHWRLISKGLHLGYRKVRDRPSGEWAARRYLGDQRYEQTTLGPADDQPEVSDALSFSEAQRAALQWHEEQSGPRKGVLSVRDVMLDYLEWYAIERKAIEQTRSRVDAHILPALGSLPISKLTSKIIRRWRDGIAETPPRRRGGKPSQAPMSADQKRARKCTANRCLATLKAGLNRAYYEGDLRSRDAWDRVKPFRGVEEPRIMYLDEDEAKRLQNACDGAFRSLVRAALLTGCRYGELSALRASDYNRDSETVQVRAEIAKNSKARYIYLNGEGVAFFEQATIGLDADHLILTHEDGRAWVKNHQSRPMRKASEAAKIPRISFHGLRHTYASCLATAGVPMPVIAAQLGHSDSRITERHYGHLSPSYVATQIREHLPGFGVAEETNVERLRVSRG